MKRLLLREGADHAMTGGSIDPTKHKLKFVHRPLCTKWTTGDGLEVKCLAG